MAHGRFQGEDIDIFLTEEDILKLGQIKVDENKIVHESLEIILDVPEGNSLKAIVQKQEFSTLGDGIEVERTEYGFFIKINEKAYGHIRETPLFGTRYDGYNKVNFRKL